MVFAIHKRIIQGVEAEGDIYVSPEWFIKLFTYISISIEIWLEDGKLKQILQRDC
jgi:hypothetical protein